MRLIDADAILCKMESVMDMQDAYLPVHFMEMVIDDMPTIEAEPVKHGTWELKHIGYGHYWECSCCQTKPNIYITKDTNYCPSCGAKMEG